MYVHVRESVTVSAAVPTGGAEGEEVRRVFPQDPEGVAETQV